ncbi:hypothetical protein ACFQ3Z_15685 [Streptomyces nogalater]
MSAPEARQSPTAAVPKQAAPRLDVYPLTGRNGFRAVGEVILPTRDIWERALQGSCVRPRTSGAKTCTTWSFPR